MSVAAPSASPLPLPVSGSEIDELTGQKFDKVENLNILALNFETNDSHLMG